MNRFDVEAGVEAEFNRALDREYDSWEDERPCAKDIDVPAWIDQDITPYDLEAIVQGGCSSGAYMSAVTYHKALETMRLYGDEVTEYIEEYRGELPEVFGMSWSGMAYFFLSCAVELWADGALEEIKRIRSNASDNY